MRQISTLRPARVALWIGIVAAVAPAALVVLGVEAVPTMIVPVALAIFPLFARTAAPLQLLSFVCGVLLTVFAWLAGFSVGVLFLPSAVAVLIAGMLTPKPPRGLSNEELKPTAATSGLVK